MKTDTTSLAFSQAGTGEPALLYLPGWCGGRDVFDPLLRSPGSARRGVSLDWRGHGNSPTTDGDFAQADLVRDAIGALADLGIGQVVPVALAHAGWVALALRRALGPERVPAVVLVDWMPLGTPPGFAEALAALQDPRTWSAARAQLFALWSEGVDNAAVDGYIRSMGEYGFDMWARAGREIARAFAANPVPLTAFAELAAAGTPCPTLHLYAQPRDDGYLAAQQGYAAEHPWFRVRRLDATSHFPPLEVPAAVHTAVEDFLASLP